MPKHVLGSSHRGGWSKIEKEREMCTFYYNWIERLGFLVVKPEYPRHIAVSNMFNHILPM